MGFRINTNIGSMNSHVQGVMTNRNLDESLQKLSSGLRINKAADDASGMAIADNLRNQADALGQDIRNANDAIGFIQIADKAMDEQVSIIDKIKQKAIQAAADGQSSKTRKMLQQDIDRLIENVNNIATQTSYNGRTLLSGAFTNGSFQVGAYSNQAIKFNVGDTTAMKNGHVHYKSTTILSTGAAGTAGLVTVVPKFLDTDGVTDFNLQSINISTSAGTGIGELARTINKYSDELGLRATYRVEASASAAITSGDLQGLMINGFTIGDISGIKNSDSDGRLVAAINERSTNTGVEAYVDYMGRLQLTSKEGRAITVHLGTASNLLGGGSFQNQDTTVIGRMTLVKMGARGMTISGTNMSTIGFLSAGMADTVVNLQNVAGSFNGSTSAAGDNIINAIGYVANQAQFDDFNANKRTSHGAHLAMLKGVTDVRTAQIVIDIADSAVESLDRIRSSLGSAQIQLESTVRNISVTQVNVKAAESGIRDVDFASESSEFSKNNILAQSGSYAMSQANQIQSNVMRLLQ